MFEELDPLLHSQLRLAVMSILISVDSAEFTYLLKKPVPPGVISVFRSRNLVKQVTSK